MGLFPSIFRRKNNKSSKKEIFPDEIFLDSSNIPDFDKSQFEGRIERPIEKKTIFNTSVFFVIIALIFTVKIWSLQVTEGEAYNIKSENNRLRHTTLFSKRGVILDRKGEILVWNEPPPPDGEFSYRKYIDLPGLSHVLGYVKYPSKDSSGFYYKEDYNGVAGVERLYDKELSGENGLRIIETNALGEKSTESVISPPKDGDSITLSIDAELQSAFYEYLTKIKKEGDFFGASGVLMDVNTGEILALTNSPEIDSNVLTSGGPASKINEYINNNETPFLNRATDGLFTPGSVVKPIIAMGVLNEKIIDPKKQILSTGSILVPNPYDPEKKSVFNDWRAHGYVDLRGAIAVSSNVYFYTVTGGFEDQKGIGIDNIVKYVNMFGLGLPIEEGSWFWGKKGVVPSPKWKLEAFDGDPWRLGDTYNTSIGQYGFQVTPLQMVRATSAIANNGSLIKPTIIKGAPVEKTTIELSSEDFQIVREGMRQTVQSGTATSLNFPFIKVAAKTGTAQVGTSKLRVNSWITGFFPYDNPRYCFVVLLEKGPSTGTFSASKPIASLLNWIHENRPEYFE